jgi:LuxR family maltose regulon positive regulatory protein
LLDDAERHLRRVDTLADRTQSALFRSWTCLGLARLAWAWGDTEVAFDEVERSITYAGQVGHPQWVRNARAHQARYWLAAGQIALARRWAESCELDPYLPPEYERQIEHVTFVRLLIAETQSGLAIKMLDAIGEHAEAQGRAGDLIEIWLLQALAHKRDGDHTAALAALDRALTLGQPAGYIRIFADEGEAVAPLLRHAATRGVHRDYAQRLLATIEGGATVPMPAQAESPDALSEREIEVLRLVSAGLPNRDIGQRLFITEKTVKKHLSNIIGKLQATNRTQAVDQARRLGLI